MGFTQLSLLQSPWLWAVLGSVLALVVIFIMRRLDRRIDSAQRAINKLENNFSRMGATWLSELLEDLVVGDEAAIISKSREIIEAVNSEAAIAEKVAKPIAFYLIDYARRNDSALLEQLRKLVQ